MKLLYEYYYELKRIETSYFYNKNLAEESREEIKYITDAGKPKKFDEEPYDLTKYSKSKFDNLFTTAEHCDLECENLLEKGIEMLKTLSKIDPEYLDNFKSILKQ